MFFLLYYWCGKIHVRKCDSVNINWDPLKRRNFFFTHLVPIWLLFGHLVHRAMSFMLFSHVSVFYDLSCYGHLSLPPHYEQQQSSSVAQESRQVERKIRVAAAAVCKQINNRTAFHWAMELLADKHTNTHI